MNDLLGVTMRPLTQADKEALVVAAAKDDHGVLYPTHVILKNNEIVGYFSLCITPLVNVWFDSKKLNARDSLNAISVIENIARLSGFKELVVPCQEQSPFFKLMNKMGYTDLGPTHMTRKELA